MLKLRNITKVYGNIKACNDISLDIVSGEFFFILGPSGCGKSSLLKIIAGLIEPDSGQVILNGSKFSVAHANERPFNMVFQDYALFPHLSVKENIAFGLKMKNCNKIEREQRVQEIMHLLQITELKYRKPSELSGGQQQRVALARAIVNRPKVLLLDEPLSALDERLRVSMQETLKSLQSTLNTTFIYVTHNQDEALTMGDRIAIMNAGKIEQLGTPADIYNKPMTRFVAEFMGDLNIVGFRVISKIQGVKNITAFQSQKELEDYCGSNSYVKKEVSIIRPEYIKITNQDSEGDVLQGAQSGLILNRIFKGNITFYLIENSILEKLKVIEFNNEYSLPKNIGSKVLITWSQQYIHHVEI